MKKVVFLLMLLLLSSGCIRFYAPGVNGQRGPRLDAANSPAYSDTIAINLSSQPIFIDTQGRTTDFIRQFDQVDRGQMLIKTDRSYRNIRVTIAWWCEGCQDKVGYSEEQLFLSMPGLYAGKPLVITDLLLRQTGTMTGFVYNVGDPTWYQDDQGNSFVLKTNEFRVFTLRSGPMSFFTKPAELAMPGNRIRGPYPYNYLKEYRNRVNLKKAEYSFQGQSYDFKIVLKERWHR